jgi:hypothetical protein
MRASSAAIWIALLQIGCLRSGSTVEMLGSRTMFLEARDIKELSSGEVVVAINLTPAEHYDGEKMCKLLRAGHPVLLRVREEPDQPPILVSSVTDDANAIIRCKTLAEANHVIDRLHAGPIRK